MHYMDPGVDTGEIIARRRVETSFDDTGRSLYRRIERASVELFRGAWPDVEADGVETTEQTEAEATYHYRSDFEELCRIDPGGRYEAKELLDVLRALTFPPFDNAFIEVDGERYYVEVEVTPADEAEDVDRVGTLSSY
jgi:methionyl-tRNA formyltransferase